MTQLLNKVSIGTTHKIRFVSVSHSVALTYHSLDMQKVLTITEGLLHVQKEWTKAMQTIILNRKKVLATDQDKRLLLMDRPYETIVALLPLLHTTYTQTTVVSVIIQLREIPNNATARRAHSMLARSWQAYQDLLWDAAKISHFLPKEKHYRNFTHRFFKLLTLDTLFTNDIWQSSMGEKPVEVLLLDELQQFLSLGMVIPRSKKLRIAIEGREESDKYEEQTTSELETVQVDMQKKLGECVSRSLSVVSNKQNRAAFTKVLQAMDECEQNFAALLNVMQQDPLSLGPVYRSDYDEVVRRCCSQIFNYIKERLIDEDMFRQCLMDVKKQIDDTRKENKDLPILFEKLQHAFFSYLDFQARKERGKLLETMYSEVNTAVHTSIVELKVAAGDSSEAIQTASSTLVELDRVLTEDRQFHVSSFNVYIRANEATVKRINEEFIQQLSDHRNVVETRCACLDFALYIEKVISIVEEKFLKMKETSPLGWKDDIRQFLDEEGAKRVTEEVLPSIYKSQFREKERLLHGICNQVHDRLSFQLKTLQAQVENVYRERISIIREAVKHANEKCAYSFEKQMANVTVSDNATHLLFDTAACASVRDGAKPIHDAIIDIVGACAHQLSEEEETKLRALLTASYSFCNSKTATIGVAWKGIQSLAETIVKATQFDYS